MSAVMEAREPGEKQLSTLQPPLVQHFELMATAPGGVAKLRELILTLAVQGKLVPQDPADEPAHVALSRVAAERSRLIAAGAIKATKQPPEISDEETPFDIPASWGWVPLADLVRVLNGRAYSKQELLDSGPTPVLRVGNLFTSNHWYFSDLELEPDKLCQPGDLLFAWSASFGPFIWDGPTAIFHYHIWKLDPVAPELFNSKYFHTFLLEKTAEIKAAGHGVSMVHMTKEKMEKIPVPWPPLAEQARIVTRVEELMRLCDALEAKDQLEAAQHAQLVQTLLGALTASTSPDELADNWQRVATHFDLLLDRPEAIDALEQTILQLAVRGLLVPQDTATTQRNHGESGPHDICTEKIGAGELPFDVPQNWRWVRLGSIAELINGDRGTNYPNKAEYVSAGLPFINTGHIEPDGTLSNATMNFLTRAKFDSLRSGKTKPGDLVYCLRGATLGKTAVVDYPEGAIASSLVIIRPNEVLDRRYAYLYLTSPLGRSLIRRFDNGSAQPNLSAASVRKYVVPLPPSEEQRRIVARVESLRRLCADLRQRLAARQTTQAHLAEALIDEVA